ncbi:MAG: Do family serine endopeptidase [Spirochaetia bacterium]|jgi:serine protease Do
MNRKWPYITAAAAVAIVGGALLLFTPVFGFTQVRAGNDAPTAQDLAAAPATTSPATESPATAGTLAAMQYSFRDVSRKVLPVVVEINVTQTVTQDVPQLPFNFPFPFGQSPDQNGGNGNGGRRTFRQSGLGSGIIVERSGDRYYVLTNNHVVKDASDISVRLSDKRVFKARVIGTDPRKDVALVSFNTRDALPVAELGDSNALQVGDLVLAVGNPFGFESTVTMGIVSALGRHGPQGDVATYTDYIQTDAAINQGNSGGALVNIQGQVIGMNTWIAAPTGGNIGLGFAIPINNARQAIQDFITKGKVTYGWLGAQIADIQEGTPYRGFAQDLKVNDVPGALLLDLFKGSPADRAGLLPGDYVTRVDTTAIANADELTQAVGRLPAGKTYTFSVIRYGEKMNVPVTLGVRDDKDQVAQGKNLWPGMTVLDIDEQVRQEANIPQGITGVAVGYLAGQDTAAAIAGFQPGDVITHVNGRTVRNVLDYYRALNDVAKRTVSFGIIRDGTDISIGLTR